MLSQENLLSSAILLIVCMNSFYVGYCVGKKNIVSTTQYNEAPQSFFKKNTISKENNNDNLLKSINIDESKVVVSLDTDDLEKKYNKLGDVKKSDENISGSIDKLKNLKK
jgi:hypothetical protein